MTTKTITLGKKPSLKDIEISSRAKDLLKKTTYSKKNETLNLIITTPAELGFTTYPTTTQLYARAKEKGYDLCPAEVGPQLAGTLEEVVWLYIGMEPITASDGDPRVFTVERCDDGGQWLLTCWASPGPLWRLGYRVVFVEQVPLDSDTSDSELGTLNLETLALRVCELEKIVRHHNLRV